MNEIRALAFFISNAIIKPKADRYLAIIKSSQGRKKFSDALCHKFESHIDQNKITKEFKADIWKKAAYSFCTSENFGEFWDTMEEAYSKNFPECVLIITHDGRAGLFIPEFPTDPVYIVV